MKKFIPLLLTAAVILALNISEKNQPQNRLLISGVSVERGAEEPLSFTVSIIDAQSEELGYVYKCVEADGLYQALERLSQTEGKPALLSLCRYLLLSEELSKSETEALVGSFVADGSVNPKLAVFGAGEGVTEFLAENQIDDQKILSLSKNLKMLPEIVNGGGNTDTLILEDGALRVVENTF